MRSATVPFCGALLLMCSAAGLGQVRAAHAVTRSGLPASSEKVVQLPLRQVVLYKNGVGYFEQVGRVSGDTLIRIDATTGQLNDVLQLLTAVDLGGGHIAGAGYRTTESFSQQLQAIAPRLGPDPTVLDLLHALRGSRVEVRGPGGVFTGKLLNVEVRVQPRTRTSDAYERRFVSLITAPGGIRTAELTPTTEVRLLDTAQRDEIGTYLQVLATTRVPAAVRHLTLEDRGVGEREVRINYIESMPAWKSNYRVVFAKSDPGAKATLQGWAVVDNTSSTGWDGVELLLVSGAPDSFIQQISRPQAVARQELAMNGTPVGMRRPELMGAAEGRSIAVDGSGIGGGAVVQVQRARPAAEAGLPAALSEGACVGADDLFEYKLTRPVTLARDESAAIPILETPVEAQRVSLWAASDPGRVQRALWLRNTSQLTLDEGAFSLTEDGIFGGQGVLPLLHPGERQLAAYGQDRAVKVAGHETRQQPPAETRHVNAAGGTLTVHRTMFREHDYVVENAAATARTVVLTLPQSTPLAREGAWSLSKLTPADEVVGTQPAGKLYRFRVEVQPSGTAALKTLEVHTHPTRYKLAELSTTDFRNLLKEAGAIAGLAAVIQPVIDSKEHLADVEEQLRDGQRGLDEVAEEEKRIRANVATLKGSAEEKPLARHYAEALLAQEAKLGPLQLKQSSLEAERVRVKRELGERFREMTFDLHGGKAEAE